MDSELKGQGIPFDPIEPEDISSPEPKPDKPIEKIEAPVTKHKKSGSNIALIIFVILTVFSISSAVALYVAKEDEINKRLKVEEDLEQLRLDKAEVERELQSTLLAKSELEEELYEEQKNYRKVLAQYEEQKSENEELMGKFDEKMKLIASLKSKLDEEQRESNKINSRLSKISKEYEQISKQLSQIRMAKEALENRIIQLSQRKKTDAVELETIVVDADKAGSAQAHASVTGTKQPHFVKLGPPARLEGQVLVVNKEFDFVVINIGEKDGIKESEVLEVYRGQEFLGKVEIERIYDTMSSAVILPEVTKQEIREGDIVKLI